MLHLNFLVLMQASEWIRLCILVSWARYFYEIYSKKAILEAILTMGGGALQVVQIRLILLKTFIQGVFAFSWDILCLAGALILPCHVLCFLCGNFRLILLSRALVFLLRLFWSLRHFNCIKYTTIKFKLMVEEAPLDNLQSEMQVDDKTKALAEKL